MLALVSLTTLFRPFYFVFSILIGVRTIPLYQLGKRFSNCLGNL